MDDDGLLNMQPRTPHIPTAEPASTGEQMQRVNPRRNAAGKLAVSGLAREPGELVRCSPQHGGTGMRNRIRLLALAVVAMGGGTLATAREAHATYAPPPVWYCCCEVNSLDRCENRCCGPRGCRIDADGCQILAT
jgi:hypothetical protein